MFNDLREYINHVKELAPPVDYVLYCDGYRAVLNRDYQLQDYMDYDERANNFCVLSYEDASGYVVWFGTSLNSEINYADDHDTLLNN